MQKALFLYNPAAGRGRIARNVGGIVDIFSENGWELTPEKIDFGRNPFDAHPDIRMVVAAGGDGTVNYVVNRMRERGLSLELGIIPAGTANDFAGIVGMAKDPLEAARQIVTGEVQALDCGVVNGLHFVNIFSFGIFTTTSQRTPDKRKHRMGIWENRFRYVDELIHMGANIQVDGQVAVIEGIKELRHMHAIPLHVRTESGEFDFNALMALVFNGETAGGFRLANTSSVRDGMFDCLLLEKRNFLVSCFAMMVRYLCGGHPRSVRHLRAATLQISSPIDEPTDVDGQRGARFPLDVRCLPGLLRVVCPRDGRR